MTVTAAAHRLSRADARHIAVRAQLLTADRPGGLDATIRRLTMVQVEPTNAVAPSADLVLWSRLGPAYRPADLRDALDEQRLVELRGAVRPAEDIRLYRAEMAQWPGPGELTEWQEHQREWVDANNTCRLDILDVLRADGPLPARALPDTCDVPWSSSGWNDNRNRRMMLDLLVQRGEVAAAGRDGRDQLWDLAERVYPDDPPVPLAEARRVRAERRLGALGIARPRRGTADAQAGEAAVIDGVRGSWRVDTEQLSQLDQPFTGRVALLSPLDRLVFDRRRLADVFAFDYQLEMYKPAARRRWGYYALPILAGDRLVGKLDAKADRSAGVLRVNGVHWDVEVDSRTVAAVEREIDDLATWLGLAAGRAASR